MIHLTDTHCHLDFDVYDEDRADVIAHAVQEKVDFILNPGIDLETSAKAIKLSHAYPGIVYAAIGFHPNHGQQWNDNSLIALKQMAQDNSVLAIGEIGLDYYRQYTPRQIQHEIFHEQLMLAKLLDLPVLIHNRDASADVIPILTDWVQSLPENSRLRQHPGVLHSFSDTLEVALSAIELNFMIGISGPVTFNNANEKKELVANLPINSILLETDAPFLTPHPWRGRRNEPAYIPLIAEEIAALHEKTIEEIALITFENANALLDFKKNL